MKTYHMNSEGWYERDWSVFHHIRNWFIWIGGWEKANGKGWELFRDYGRGKRLVSPAPVSLFGHRITFLGRGGYVRIGKRYLVWSPIGRWKVYLSPDATTSSATTWLWGAPHEIVVNSYKP